jgi:hypothetical protein
MIAGQITAPGTVIIQNNHGVVFSGTARVDVGSLVATSQTVDAGRFAADGRLKMRGGEAAGARVENQGSITVREAGLAALVGGRVANSGAIVARRGTVALASGETTTIDLAGDGVVQLAVSGDAGRADAGVENTGLIDAGGGRVVLTAGTASGLLSNVINTSGVIRAASADGAGGTIELLGRGGGTVRVAGNLDASGATRGGAVTVTGLHVQVASTARVTASGREAGGSVRIGGDRQGTGTLRRAETAAVAAGARIEARATEGAGGSVILWADRETRFDGAIDVTGPASGGFAETSAVDLLEVGDAAVVDVGPGGQWLIDPVNITINAAQAATIVGTLDGGGNVTVTTELPGAEPGNLTVNSSIVWSGAGNLTLFANNNLNINNNIAITSSGAGSLEARALVDTSIAGPVTSTGSGSIRFDTGRNLTVNHDVIASGTGAVTLLAGTGNIIASNAGNDRHVLISTTSGRLRIGATEGSVLLRRLAAANTRNVRVQSTSGDIDITAGTAIEVRGNQGSSWARVRSESGAISMTAPDIRVIGGSGGNAFAEVVAGAGGAVTMQASRRIEVQNGAPGVQNGAPGSPARVSALDGATLTMRAPQQIWNGFVRVSGSLGPDIGTGGEVRVAGGIAAGVAPIFNLGPGSDFTLEPATPGPGAATTASGYTSPVGLRVDTRGAGAITLNAPVVLTGTETAGRATLVSEERVTLAPDATIRADGTGDAVVIAAGRGFDNRAGAAALAAPNGRWLLLLDRFDGMLGTEPATAEFDLYDRPFAYADPMRSAVPAQIAALGILAGNRIVYGEQPVLTVTGESLSKTFGTAVMRIGATTDAAGLRPKDGPLANILEGGTTATSAGAPADADAGTYDTTPIARLTDRGAVQRYRLVLVDGTLTVDRAQLLVAAEGAARLYGAPNPAFGATITGFVLGQDASVLGGSLVFQTNAVPSSPVGSYAITPAGLTSTNYAIVFVPGTLTVNPAPLTVTANDATRPEGQPNPPFTATITGFVLGEDAAVLGGLLALTTAATQASPPGTYAIIPSGLTSANYAISFIDGVLTVTPLGVPPGPAPQAGLVQGPEPFRRGVQPFTPADAGFRTTVLEAGPAVADPFRLAYSLGEVIQLAVGQPTFPGGFVPAAGRPEGAAPDDPGICGGPINLGPRAAGCQEVELTETYWTTIGREAR